MTAARIPMHDFYAHSRPMPLDQADGLRRMFAGRQLRVLALVLVANPFVAFSGVVLDRLAAVLAAPGRQGSKRLAIAFHSPHQSSSRTCGHTPSIMYDLALIGCSIGAERRH